MPLFSRGKSNMWNEKTIEKKPLTEHNWKAVNGNLLMDLGLPLRMIEGSRHFRCQLIALLWRPKIHVSTSFHATSVTMNLGSNQRNVRCEADLQQ